MSVLSFGQRLRDTVARQGTIQVPGAPTPLMGKLVAQMGFPATYLSGGAFSASALAVPDVGLFTLSELAEEARRLCRAVDIPVIVDADTGFGDLLNVQRTVQELEQAGAAAIQLEDQQLPKRCGHLSGKSLIDAEAMCAKIRMAVATREDPQLVIVARTDARAVEGFDQALIRARQYVQAGADWVFPEALVSEAEFSAFARQLPVPLVANMTEFGKSPLLSQRELADLGFAVVLYPVTLLRAAMKTAQRVLSTIAEHGSQVSELDAMQSRTELYELLGYEDFGPPDIAYDGTSEHRSHPPPPLPRLRVAANLADIRKLRSQGISYDRK